MERNERSGDPLARLRLEQKDIDFILQKIRPGLSDKEILAIRALDDPQMFARIYKGLLKDKALHERLESRRGSLERRVQKRPTWIH
ncbi:MAG: hypothetical protein UZ21_OP11001000558 [Microgenomates bacterium OLB22]|nr:MAG: hypothetical protein UZ21_OP11001000558 [Microgenomates bacterium OLB22]